MTTAGIRAGDIVLCDKGGRRYHALFKGPDGDGRFRIEPISHGITYRTVTAHQIVAHYKKMGRKRG
jgi:hypothetical protein